MGWRGGGRDVRLREVPGGARSVGQVGSDERLLGRDCRSESVQEGAGRLASEDSSLVSVPCSFSHPSGLYPPRRHQVLPKREGLLHVSEWGYSHVRNVADVVKEGDLVDVMVLEVQVGCRWWVVGGGRWVLGCVVQRPGVWPAGWQVAFDSGSGR